MATDQNASRWGGFKTRTTFAEGAQIHKCKYSALQELSLDSFSRYRSNTNIVTRLLLCLLNSTNKSGIKNEKKDGRNRWIAGILGGVAGIEVVVIIVVGYAVASGTAAYLRRNLE